MRDMLEIAPSLLSADFGYLMKDIESVEKECRFLHLDVMDGHYVPNLSIGIPVIKSIRKYSDMIFDTHLMITEPEKYVKAFADAGSDYITFHIECPCKSQLVGMLPVSLSLGGQQHRPAVVYHQLAAQVRLLFKTFHIQPVRAAIQLPVDIAGRLPDGILAVLGKLNRKTMKRTPMQADEETFHNLACKEVQRFVFL